MKEDDDGGARGQEEAAGTDGGQELRERAVRTGTVKEEGGEPVVHDLMDQDANVFDASQNTLGHSGMSMMSYDPSLLSTCGCVLDFDSILDGYILGGEEAFNRIHSDVLLRGLEALEVRSEELESCIFVLSDRVNAALHCMRQRLAMKPEGEIRGSVEPFPETTRAREVPVSMERSKKTEDEDGPQEEPGEDVGRNFTISAMPKTYSRDTQFEAYGTYHNVLKELVQVCFSQTLAVNLLVPCFRALQTCPE